MGKLLKGQHSSHLRAVTLMLLQTRPGTQATRGKAHGTSSACPWSFKVPEIRGKHPVLTRRSLESFRSKIGAKEGRSKTLKIRKQPTFKDEGV